MSTPNGKVRASDAERERVATRVSDAAVAGRLTMTEADERMALVYQTRFRDELDQFTADLPDDEARRSQPRSQRWHGRGIAERFPTRLRIHALVAVVFSTLAIVRWLATDTPYFFPAGPMFLLFGSLLMHAMFVARARGWSGGPGWARQAGSPPWSTREPR